MRIARSEGDVAGLADVWRAVGVSYLDADLDFFLASARLRASVERPHVVVVECDGQATGLVVGWLECVPFRCRIGYLTVYRPSLRTLRLTHGGVSGADDSLVAATLVGEIVGTLARGEADAAVVPAVRVGSALDEALKSLPIGVRKQPATPYLHHRLILPPTYEELLASRDRKSRYNLKRQCAQLEQKFGDRLTIDVLADVGSFDRVVHDLDSVARKTYQRGLGAGFIDSPERRELVRLALERGLFCAWLLAIDGCPVAFWQGTHRGRTFFLNSAGYDPELARAGVGTYLQLRMLRDLCGDDNVDVVDFGWGDADYKSRFGNDSWPEYDVTIFAPTFRGTEVALLRRGIVSLDRGARRAAGRIGATRSLKRLWRSQLRRKQAA